MTIIVAHRGASGDGAREHDGGLPAGRRGGRRRDRARRPPDRRRPAGRDPRRDPRPDDGPHRAGRRADDGRDSRGRCRRALRAPRRFGIIRSPGRAFASRPCQRSSSGSPKRSASSSRSRPARPPTPSSQAIDGHPAQAGGRSSVISFDEGAIDRVRELDPSIRTGYLLAPGQPIDEALAWASGRGHTGVHPWEGDLGADPLTILAQAKTYGLEVGCYVVNDPDRMQFLADTGIWGFVTDVPDVAWRRSAALARSAASRWPRARRAPRGRRPDRRRRTRR